MVHNAIGISKNHDDLHGSNTKALATDCRTILHFFTHEIRQRESIRSFHLKLIAMAQNRFIIRNIARNWNSLIIPGIY